jgi:peroxiredoxin family protein
VLHMLTVVLAAILESGDLHRIYTALSLLVSTASEGEPARGLVSFGALEPLLADDLEARAAQHGDTFARSLAELRATAQELDDCRLYACAAAVETSGTTNLGRLDGVMSTPRFLKVIGDARLVVV